MGLGSQSSIINHVTIVNESETVASSVLRDRRSDCNLEGADLYFLRAARMLGHSVAKNGENLPTRLDITFIVSLPLLLSKNIGFSKIGVSVSALQGRLCCRLTVVGDRKETGMETYH